MQRTLIAVAFGLASGFRVNPNKAGVLVPPSSLVEEAPPRAICSLSGDPHTLTFDASWKGGHMWHATQAPGHWWLVKTDSRKILVQATYANCNGATCMSGVAVSGSFIGRSKLIIQPPCLNFNVATRQCATPGEKSVRITWNGARVQSLNEKNGMAVTVSGNRVTATLPEGVVIELDMFWDAFMNARISMVQGSGGPQCGHCGNFDGNWQNDHIYDAKGQLTPANTGGCDAWVPCEKRLIPGDEKCTGIIPDDQQRCPADLRTKIEKICQDKLAAAVDATVAGKIPMNIKDDELDECISDGCVDAGFEGADAKDAAELDADLLNPKLMAMRAR